MLLMEHYNIKCCNNLLGGKLWTSPDQQKDSTGSMDQSAWRYSKIERLVGVSLTCNQLYLFWLRREVEKKHLIQFIFLHELTNNSPHLKWIKVQVVDLSKSALKLNKAQKKSATKSFCI